MCVGVAYGLCLCDESRTSPVKYSYVRGWAVWCAGWCDLMWLELRSQHLLIYRQGHTALVAVCLYQYNRSQITSHQAISRIFAVPPWRSTLCYVQNRQRDRERIKGWGNSQDKMSHTLGFCYPYWMLPLTYRSLSWSEQTAWFSGNMSLTCCILVFKMASRWVLQNRHINRFLLIHATGFGSHSLNYFLHNRALKPFIHELSHYIGSTIYAWML